MICIPNYAWKPQKEIHHIFLIKAIFFDKNRFSASSRILSFSSKNQIFWPEEGIKVVNLMKLTIIFWSIWRPNVCMCCAVKIFKKNTTFVWRIFVYMYIYIYIYRVLSSYFYIYIYKSRKKVFVKTHMSKRKKMSFLFISLPWLSNELLWSINMLKIETRIMVHYLTMVYICTCCTIALIFNKTHRMGYCEKCYWLGWYDTWRVKSRSLNYPFTG